MRTGLLFISLIFLACTGSKPEDEPWVNICPDLQWLDSIQGTIIQNGSKGEIYLCQYKNERVFLIHDCLNCADALSVVKNCDGVTICEFGGIVGMNTCPDFEATTAGCLLYWKN